MRIGCVASRAVKSQDFLQVLNNRYTTYPLEESDIIISLGGDGFLLHVLHKYMHLQKPIYGINCGTLGFLLNNNNLKQDIFECLNNTNAVDIHPLKGDFTNTSGQVSSSFAFNEISFLRSDPVASHIKVLMDKKIAMEKLVADGILIATPTGSTAYNRACGGTLISINSNLLVITPINPFHPLNWRGTTFANHHIIDIINLESKNRKLSVSCDFKETKNIEKATISLDKSHKMTLLFDKDNDLESKILKSQFYQ